MITGEKLISNIYDNFKNHDLNLHKNKIVHNYFGDIERDEILNFYEHKTWEDALEHKNMIYASHITFLTPIAIAKYIPAFMIYCIEDPENADVLVTHLLWSLANNKEQKYIFEYLSVPQKETIKKFIDFMYKENYQKT